MEFIRKTRKKLSELLEYDLSNAEKDEINEILRRSRIARIRQWDSSMPAPINQMVQSGTRKVVRDYVRGKRNK